MEKDPARPSRPRKAASRSALGHGPWPTTDSLRLALLARLQDAETVDLVEFFRKVYPEALAVPHGPKVTQPSSGGAAAGADKEVKNV